MVRRWMIDALDNPTLLDYYHLVACRNLGGWLESIFIDLPVAATGSPIADLG